MQFDHYTSIKNALIEGRTTCQVLVDEYLQRIAECKEFNIFLEVWDTEARDRAAFLDKKLQENPDAMGRLFGMVLSIKDVLCYSGHEVSAASKMLKGFISPYSATAIQRLLAEDAILIGRVNCDEFAMGSSNENSAFGPVKNPLAPGRVPGGSSGGSAAAVACGTCLASIGSDTGGSVRQPAAFCGVLGLKPTYGSISRHGLIAYASSFDQIGILTKHPSDAALLLDVMAGPDDFDGTVTVPKPSATKLSDPVRFGSNARIAYFPEVFEHPALDHEIRAASSQFLTKLNQLGYQIEPVHFEYLDYLVPTYYVLTTAEASSNLSRYDGIRYGNRSDQAVDVKSLYQKSRTEGLGNEVQRRILLGTFVLSAGYHDAYFLKAQQVRRLIHDQINQILSDFDFIIMPVSPVKPWRIGEKISDPVSVYLSDIFTVLANLAGIPAISFPIGKTTDELPMGIQLMAAKMKEAELLALTDHLLQSIDSQDSKSDASLH